MPHGHLLTPLPPAGADEILDTLLKRDGVRIERIVSSGQATAEGVWYDQDEHEFVVLLQGAATLRLEGQAGAADEVLHLTPGAWVDLPPTAATAWRRRRPSRRRCGWRCGGGLVDPDKLRLLFAGCLFKMKLACSINVERQMPL